MILGTLFCYKTKLPSDVVVVVVCGGGKGQDEAGKGGRARKRGFCVCQRESRDRKKRKEEAPDGGDHGRRAAGRLFSRGSSIPGRLRSLYYDLGA